MRTTTGKYSAWPYKNININQTGPELVCCCVHFCVNLSSLYLETCHQTGRPLPLAVLCCRISHRLKCSKYSKLIVAAANGGNIRIM